MSKTDKAILIASMIELIQHINRLVEDAEYGRAQISYEILRERARRLEDSR